MLYGLHNSLSDPSTVLLGESLAVALFGNDNPQNKMIRVDNELDMMVGGVYEDFPSNTTFFGTQFLLPWDNQANWMTTVKDWDNHTCQLFVQLTDEADVNRVNSKIKNLPTPYVKRWKEEIMIQPLDRLHLYSEFENGIEAGGRIEFVWLFGIIGGFVLLLASINFMNLSTARSEQRAREVGIRKAVGSVRGQLVSQFLIESVVVTTAAVVLSLVLAQLSLPFFSDMADKKIFIPWGNVTFWILVAGFALIIGLISGSYPALYLSSFKPIKALKGAIRAGHLAVVPRKALVVIQFTVSITLVIGTLVVFRQINFAKDRPAGYSRNGLITVPINTADLQRHFEVIQNDLLQDGVVEHIAASSQSPAHFANNTSMEWPGKREDQSALFFRNVTVTSEFGKTVGWTIKSGRDFSRDFVADSSAVVLNEKAIEIMGLADPIGTRVKYDGQDFTIIGIVNDMVTQSPYEPAQPTVFFGKGWLGVIDIRLRPSLSVQESLAKIESIFKKYNPSSPFQYNFVDEVYGRKFRNEEKIGSMANLFAMLAIFISCLGLFGLASFVAEQRTKEIGIRKVLGASVLSLWGMLSKDFVVLIFLSFILSIPLSFSLLTNWLQQYSYRTTMPWHLFIAAGAGAVMLTLMTISYHAVRAAVTNPVKSLRSE
jgi:ABC-type antimicrobial peptide transport system permease subunit